MRLCALVLGLTTLLLAIACGPDSTATQAPFTDTPASGPTATAVQPGSTEDASTATPTAEPSPAIQVLSGARAAVDTMGSYRFSFEVSNADGKIIRDGSGEWAVPAGYRVGVRLPVCPPPVPGVPEVTDCDLLDVYDAITTANGPYYDPVGSGWQVGSRNEQYGIGFLDRGVSPAANAVDVIATLGELALDPTMPLEVFEGEAFFRISGKLDGTSAELWAEHKTHLPLRAIVTGADGTTWTWTFTDHGATITIPAFEQLSPSS